MFSISYVNSSDLSLHLKVQTRSARDSPGAATGVTYDVYNYLVYICTAVYYRWCYLSTTVCILSAVTPAWPDSKKRTYGYK